jgi:hypothetical protein
MIRSGSASVYETPLRLSPASADNTKGVRTMLRQTKFIFLAALAVFLLYAYSEGYMVGNCAETSKIVGSKIEG